MSLFRNRMSSPRFATAMPPRSGLMSWCRCSATVASPFGFLAVLDPDCHVQYPLRVRRDVRTHGLRSRCACQCPLSTPTAECDVVAEPAGTLDAGPKEMGLFFFHPRTLGNPRVFVQSWHPAAKGCFRRVSTSRCWNLWRNLGRLPDLSTHYMDVQAVSIPTIQSPTGRT